MVRDVEHTLNSNIDSLNHCVRMALSFRHPKQCAFALQYSLLGVRALANATRNRLVHAPGEALPSQKVRHSHRRFATPSLNLNARCEGRECESVVNHVEHDRGKSMQNLEVPQQDVSYQQWHEDGQDKKEVREGNWNGKLAWLGSMVEPAINLYKRLPPPGELLEKGVGTATARSLVEIATSLRESTAGMQQWGITDITLGLYLLSVRHAADMAIDAIGGKKVTSDIIVKEWLYLMELAWGSYQKDAHFLARVTMLRERNVVKFVTRASVMQPAYYIAIDARHMLVVLCIRGTQSMHDVLTDLASHSQHAGVIDGEIVHYGSLEAARWFFKHEVATLKNCLQEHQGYGLLLVGHSLGGSAACLLGVMLRERSQELLGLCPEQVKVVGIGTPPCVSEALAGKCKEFTSTLVLQDDAVARMSSVAFLRLRNEILLTDWNVLLKEGIENKGLVDLVAGTIHALASVHDAARKYVGFARWSEDLPKSGESLSQASKKDPSQDFTEGTEVLLQNVAPTQKELFSPGTLFHLCNRPIETTKNGKDLESQAGYVMWQGNPGALFGRIILSRTMFSDHRCESYYYALRDVLKGIPLSKSYRHHLSNHLGL